MFKPALFLYAIWNWIPQRENFQLRFNVKSTALNSKEYLSIWQKVTNSRSFLQGQACDLFSYSKYCPDLTVKAYLYCYNEYIFNTSSWQSKFSSQNIAQLKLKYFFLWGIEECLTFGGFESTPRCNPFHRSQIATVSYCRHTKC